MKLKIREQSEEDISNGIIDISMVPLDHIMFAWLSPLCEANKVSTIIVTVEQSRYVFSNGDGPCNYYRGCEIKLKKHERRSKEADNEG